jgi:hypothetical protein
MLPNMSCSGWLAMGSEIVFHALVWTIFPKQTIRAGDGLFR